MAGADGGVLRAFRSSTTMAAHRIPESSSQLSVVARVLARDPLVWLQAATAVVVLAFLLQPDLPVAQQGHFASSWLSVVFLVLPVVGCFAGVGRISDARERRFWLTVAGSLACWLFALVVHTQRPDGPPSVVDLLADAGYLGFYILFFVAVDGQPRHEPLSGSARLHRTLRSLGFSVFAVGWAVYFVVVPTLVGAVEQWPSAWESALFVLLDLTVLTRVVAVWQQAETPRWRILLALIATATVLLTLSDLLGLGDSLDMALWPTGHGLDLLWGLPGTAYLFAVRARHAALATATLERRQAPTDTSAGPIGTFLMLGTMSFPLVHSVAVGLRWLPPAPALHGVLWVVMLASSAAMVVLVVLANWALARERVRVQAERLALEARLLQAQKMEAIGRLAGGIAHDFNNLLTAIGSYTDLVIENTPPGDANRPMLEEVRAATNKAGALTRQLLAFGRRQTVKVESIDLSRLLLDMRNMLQRVIGEDVQLETHLDEHLGLVCGHAGQLEQVLLHLVVNARDAMPGGGALRIDARVVTLDDTQAPRYPGVKPGRFVRIEVADTGAGIPAEVLPRIFDPFFTTKDRDKGTGLGLSMVYGAVRQAGGAVEIDSREGRGTTVTVLLPSMAEASAADAPSAPARDAAAMETVLVAEDDQQVRSLARAILSRQGYRVLEGASSSHAATLAETYPEAIDLLLTDVVMPEFGGAELAQRVRRSRPGVRVLFMSGYADGMAVAQQALPAPSAFLPKPFTPAQLVRAVRHSLEQSPGEVVRP